MKLYLAKKAAPSRSSRAAAAPETPWVRFGDETVFIGADEASPPARNARQLAPEVSVSRKQLYVVVQNGRLFQQHNPRVPVLHDRGRYLLVKLDPRRAQALSGKHETCFDVLPLIENEAVFEVSARGAAARAPVPFVQNLVNVVQKGPFETNLKRLVGFTTRHSNSTQFQQALTFSRQQLNALNYQTRLQQVTVGSGSSNNLIADKTGMGSAASRQVVVVTAHLDSINLSGPTAPAPGADDNASGSAGILELARVFAAHKGKHDLRLILFGGEEQGLFGSKRYVASLTGPQRAKLRAVVNMDMIGSLNTPQRTVLVEGKLLSEGVIKGLSIAAATYTQLKVETSLNAANSDHVPFLNAGLPAVLTIEGADSTNHTVHSANDTLNRINFTLALEILRMNAAFIATEIGKA
jgi:hypothetical protein